MSKKKTKKEQKISKNLERINLIMEKTKDQNLLGSSFIHYYLMQYGPEGLFCANFIGQQQKFSVPGAPELGEVVALSPMNHAASLFKRRHYMPSETLSGHIKDFLNYNASFRGSTVMNATQKDSKYAFNLYSSKSLKVFPCYLVNPDEYTSSELDRLGIQGGNQEGKKDVITLLQESKNDLSTITIYGNCKFKCVLELNHFQFNPNNNETVKMLVDTLNDDEKRKKCKLSDEDEENILNLILNSYFINDENLIDLDAALNNLKERVQNYTHGVHKQWGYTLATEDVQTSTCGSIEEVVEFKKKWAEEVAGAWRK